MTQEYRLDLDPKGRVTIPAKLRKSLGSQLILCLVSDDERDLYVYTPKAWQEIMETIDSRSLTAQQRFMLTHADIVVPDTQGRITIHQRYIEALHIERAVTLRFTFRCVSVPPSDA